MEVFFVGGCDLVGVVEFVGVSGGIGHLIFCSGGIFKEGMMIRRRSRMRIEANI